MPVGIIYLISPVMERSDLAGGMDAPPRTLPAGIVYPISPVMAHRDLAGGRLAGIHRQSIR